MHLRGLLRTRVFRYTAIAVLAFSVGSASVVLAAGSGAMQLPTFRLGDGTNPDQFAKVDAAGSLQVSVANQPGTQQVSGTVSVNNFPATQNVSGTVKTTPSLATRLIDRFFGPLDAGDSGDDSFTPINASFINVTSISGTIEVSINGSIGQVFDAFLGDNEVHTMTLTQQIPLSSIHVHCANVVFPCAAHVIIVGN